MATRQRYQAGVLREQWTNATQSGDATPAGYTAWDTTGANPATRALTAAETAMLVADDSAVNGAVLTQRAQAALTANATFLAIATPTNAQTVNQVQALTKECTAVIRLLLGLLDTTSGS